MDPMMALMRPTTKEDELQALADTLRKRKRAADFFSISTIKPLQQMAQSRGEEIQATAERHGVLREALAQRTAERKQAEAKQAFDAEQKVLDRQNRIDAAGARGPLVTMTNGEPDPGAASYWKERGAADSKALDSIYAQSDVAQKFTDSADLFADIMDGVETGALADMQVDLWRAAASVGIEIPPDADKMQAGRSISNQLALMFRNPESGFGLTGGTSDKDVRFLKEIAPRIVNTPGGNKIIVEVLKRLGQRAIERSAAATKYEQDNGRFNKADFERQWNEYSKNTNLFDDLAPEDTAPPVSNPDASDLYQMSDDDLAARLKAARERVRE